MNNPRLATRYAKSLLDLSIEQNNLDAVHKDMQYIQKMVKSNPDFVAVLRSPVITSDKKEKILGEVMKDRVSRITILFINLLTAKTRESNLPEIAGAFLTQYNELKNIRVIKITTAAPISEEMKQNIVSKVALDSNAEVEVETAIDTDLIGGFKLETGDTLIDATILRDLNDVRKQFMNNEYIHSIR